jgi:phosphoglycolate phosphatase-like HAD superfamily hydrolase
MQKQIHTLVLVDHDGTLCQTSPTAYDSLRYALEHALRLTKLTPKFIDLETILTQLTGTTEKRLIQELISVYQVALNKQSLFETSFYNGRANWYKTMKSHDEFVFDTYFPDMEFVIEKAVANPNYHLGLVTGNPVKVIEERLSPHIKKYFMQKGQIFGSFGEETSSRKELITSAITKAESTFPDFVPLTDVNGFFTNVFYIGDSKHDFIAGLSAKVKTIYIPSRSLQHAKLVQNEEYVKLLDEVLKGEAIVTNDCASSTTLTFLGLE